jgi:hypothetical protein
MSNRLIVREHWDKALIIFGKVIGVGPSRKLVRR